MTIWERWAFVFIPIRVIANLLYESNRQHSKNVIPFKRVPPWDLFDFKEGQKSVIQIWLDRERITKRDRGQLAAKLDLLRRHGPSLPPKLLAGPLRSKNTKLRQKNVYKLIIHGDRMLRPFLCKGPISNDTEFTLLLGVIERDGENDHDPAEGEAIRQQIIEDPSRRMPHERYR